MLKKYTDKNAEYFYNAKGLRFKKKVGDKEFRYFYDGEKLIAAQCDEDWYHFFYDIDGICGFSYRDHVVRFVKDAQNNVIALVAATQEVAVYSYDAWGNCKILKDTEGIGAINPIRWKSQYYDTESGFYYIAGRYYSPVTKQFLSPVNPETVLTDSVSAYGLNLYSLCLTNPVDLAYNEYTIEPGVDLVFNPPTLSSWDLFWQNVTKFWNLPIGKGFAITLFCFATLFAILNPEFLPLYFETLVGVAASLLTGATVSGLYARENGNPFWRTFGNYLNDNWSQTLAVSMAVFIIIYGVTNAYQAFSQLGNKNTCNSQCFKEGTLVFCLGKNGEETLKRIEEITVGDRVLAYDEKTGKQAYKSVKRLFRNKTDEWYHIRVNNEEIVCTGGHPFYVADLGQFIPARNLRTGDKLLLSDGTCVTIDSITVEKLAKPETTYNFEVEDFHTYFVSNCKILVHNLCNRKLNEYKNKILSNEDVVLNTKDDALELINKKFADYPQELAHARSAKGWHFDSHPINGSITDIDHINLYNKRLHISVHITWRS